MRRARRLDRSIFDGMKSARYAGEKASMKFKIKQNLRQEFFWELVAGNGELICASEPYQSKESAVKSINLVKLESGHAEISDTTVIFRKASGH